MDFIDIDVISYCNFNKIKMLYTVNSYWQNKVKLIKNFEMFDILNSNINKTFSFGLFNIIKIYLNCTKFTIKTKYILILAKHGYLDIIKWINKHFPYSVILNKNLIRIGCNIGNLKMVDYFYNQNKNMVMNSVGQVSPLSIAALYGHVDIFIFLFQTKSINLKDCQKAIKIATFRGHLPILEHLISHNVNLHFDNSKLLEIAAKNNNIEIVKLLYENKISTINNQALTLASEKGYFEIVKYLCDNKFDVHFNQNSALRHSAKNGHLNIVQYLHESGADIRARNDYAIGNAVLNKHTTVVEYLIKNGVDKLACDFFVMWYFEKN